METVAGMRVWGSDIEPGTIDQAARTNRLPILAGPLALMPDAHVGIGATVGSVIPTLDAVIPAAVGVDIGCGMIAVETDLVEDGLPDDLDKLHGWIAQVVPAGVGKGHAGSYRPGRQMPDPPKSLTSKQAETAAAQFGSLGSGNHFVEVCVDERFRVWVVLHSGSRGIGNQLATGHIKTAKLETAARGVKLEDPDLAYVVQGTPEFDAYIADMLWAQAYALGNRESMMDEVLAQLFGFVGAGREVWRINCHHNYTARTRLPDGRDVWLTRKGAIDASDGRPGVIPGSMATGSYIVRGLGNPDSYCSCSHGAGRRMSRGRAKRELSVDSLVAAMAGKAWNGTAEALLDEHPDAYKRIEDVMNDQADLVAVEHTLRQVLNYKGT